MHYMFDSEERIRSFLHNVTDRLEPGGFFIGTTVDSECVVGKIREEGEDLNIGNSLYRI